MNSSIIRVENLSKQYVLSHQKQQKYNTIRDAIAQQSKALLKSIHPKTQNSKLKTQSYQEEFWALKDVSFEINQGDRVGIIGRNGAGKSTLLKILSRITEPSSGRIAMNGRVASLLEVGTGFHPELSGRENIFLNGAILGMNKAEIQRKFDEIVAFAEVEKFLDTPVKRYSSGMYVRLAFAVAAHLEPEILIVDEVLAVGDAQFQKKCLGKMEDVSKEGRTVLFVSHNMGTISTLCTKGIYLKSGSINFSGSIQKVIAHYLTSFQNDSGQTPGILFKKERDKNQVEKIQILEISLLDQHCNLKEVTKTWDYIRIRIRYYSPNYISNGSIVLEASTSHGTKIFQHSTLPLSGISLEIQKGESYADCIIPCLPLGSGSYLLSFGFAIPMSEWLCWQENIAVLEISDHDIYQSNTPPNQERTILAIEHHWEFCEK